MTTRGWVVCPILLVLQVEDCWGRPTMFPFGGINVELNFDDIVRGDEMLTTFLKVACGLAFRRADGSTDFKVVGRGFILAHSFLKVGDLHVVNSGQVVGIGWILGWAGEGIPSLVEERIRVSCSWVNPVSDVRVKETGAKVPGVEGVVKTMN